jgi:hypothetical protein
VSLVGFEKKRQKKFVKKGRAKKERKKGKSNCVTCGINTDRN